MKNRWLALVALIVLLAGCHQTTWKEFSSGDGKFSVLMPGTPTEEIKNVNTPIGAIALHLFMVEQKDKKVAYLATYSDYPATAMQSVNVEKALDDARDGAVSNVHGRLLAESPVSLLNKYPGREIQIETPDGKHALRNRMYLVKNRMYQVLIVTAKDSLFSNDAAKYMDSFKLQEN